MVNYIILRMNKLKLLISKHNTEKGGRHQEFILYSYINFEARKNYWIALQFRIVVTHE